MRLPLVLAAGLTTLVLSGCASAGSSSAGNAAPAADDIAEAGSSAVRWSGSFAPTAQRTGALAGSDRARTYGSATLVMKPGDRTRSLAKLSLTVPATVASQALEWAILPGRCGSGAVPVMATNLFPPIEVGGNSRAEVNTELPLTVPSSGSFHINVYWPGGNQLESVMACSNLRRDDS